MEKVMYKNCARENSYYRNKYEIILVNNKKNFQKKNIDININEFNKQ